VRQPFNVDTVAQAAATAVLEDLEYLERAREVNRQGLRQLEAGLSELGLEWIPSAGNFVTVDVGDNAQDVFEGLLEQGVIVRPVAGYGMPRHLRVTVGLAGENERFLRALKKTLADHGT
jgi:histidinol-phosphate aminotransferase